uniref:ABC transporter permease n=1 Tax=Fervidicoccus fontis TaxID=683846 RepID=A0A7J3ZJC1_9CREN
MIEGVEWFVRTSIEYGTPLLLAALGEVYSERSGVLNLGLEGLMALGAAAAVAFSIATGSPWCGMVLACLLAALLALVHAIVSVILRGNQIVSGLALTIIGIGLSSIVGSNYVGLRGNPITSVIEIHALNRIPVLSGLSGLDPVAYFTMVTAIVLWLVLFKTSVGLKIRATGEDPSVVEAMGHSVRTIRFLTVVFGGAMAGLAGSYITLVLSPGWYEGIVAGRGWLALGIVIFASWSPLRALLVAYLFGGLMQLRFVLAPYLGVGGVLLKGLPYVLVIVILALLSVESMRKKIGAPESLGKPYPPG